MVFEKIFVGLVCAYLVAFGIRAMVTRRLPIYLRSGFSQREVEPWRGRDALIGGAAMTLLGVGLALWRLS